MSLERERATVQRVSKVFPKLWKLVLSGWGRYLKVTLNVWPKISAHVDGGPSGGSSVLGPESEDPHPPERTF